MSDISEGRRHHLCDLSSMLAICSNSVISMYCAVFFENCELDCPIYVRASNEDAAVRILLGCLVVE